jgi:hypothetical protein
MKSLQLLLAFSLFFYTLRAQETPPKKEYANIAAIVFLDSFVVTAKRQGFNVEEFIDLVQEDESFYKAFKNLRQISYTAENSMQFYDKKNRNKAEYASQTRQFYQEPCRTMDVISSQNSGNFYKKNGKYRYYTAKMFDQVFYTHGEICESNTSLSSPTPPKGIQKHVSELKKLIFQPGEEVDVPIIGKKTALFTEDMVKYYDYSITSTKYKNQFPAYVFAAKVKPMYSDKKEGKTVIKYLETYFEKETFQVLGRKYQLLYKGALFDFDVNMEIELKKLGNVYLPEYIKYEGEWNIPTKKIEKGWFEIKFSDFK